MSNPRKASVDSSASPIPILNIERVSPVRPLVVEMLKASRPMPAKMTQKNLKGELICQVQGYELTVSWWHTIAFEMRSETNELGMASRSVEEPHPRMLVPYHLMLTFPANTCLLSFCRDRLGTFAMHRQDW
jgi:hypothetical protein